MGLFDKAKELIKGELIDVVEWLDNSQNIILHRFDRRNDGAIKNGAQLTVRESQVAVFVNEGEIGDIFTPGRYELTTNNLPILTKLKSWKYGFDSPFKCEVYFINTKVFTAQKWGTPANFYVRDQDFGRVTIRAFGTYSMQVTDATKFIQKLSGTNGEYTTNDIADELRSIIVTNLVSTIGESGKSLLDFAAEQSKMSKVVEQRINSESDYGITFTKFLISSITLPEELQKKLDEGTGMNMLGDMNKYQQMSMADAMKAAASNPGNGGGGQGMMEMMMMNNMMQNQQMQQQMLQQQMMQNQGYGQAGYGQAAPPPPPPMSQYYVAVNGQQQGPFPLQTLQQMAAQGQFTPSTQVWKQGMATWAAASTVAELSQVFGAVPPPPPPAM
ncbi:MAG: SPFH domain-containing protein [Bacteroidales bacterium]|jgi:membrane protease subunit (stomatin/prohibitin family)|nr:SPFH domain-containing protein [Bacteroidales bacterium]